jgi:hypothetical protein
MADGSVRDDVKSKKAPSAAAAKAVPKYDPEKDYISKLRIELGQAHAIVDLLFSVASEGDPESLFEGTLESSLFAVMERLDAIKAAADAILDEQTVMRDLVAA